MNSLCISSRCCTRSITLGQRHRGTGDRRLALRGILGTGEECKYWSSDQCSGVLLVVGVLFHVEEVVHVHTYSSVETST
jgi:hypothetical protein